MASNLDAQIEKLWRCELIKESEVKALCSKCREILAEEANVQRVDLPVTVRRIFFSPLVTRARALAINDATPSLPQICGDIHGQVRLGRFFPQNNKK